MGRSPFLGARSPVFARDKSLSHSPLLEIVLEGVEAFGLQLPVPVVDLDTDFCDDFKDPYDDFKETTLLGQKLGDCLSPNLGVQVKHTFLDIYESCQVVGRPRASTDSAIREASQSAKSESTRFYLDAELVPSANSDGQKCLGRQLGDDLSPRVGVRVKNTFLDLHEACPYTDARPRASTDFYSSFHGPTTCAPTSAGPDAFHFAPAWCYVEMTEDEALVATPVDLTADDELQHLVAEVQGASPSERLIHSVLGPLPSRCHIPDWKGPHHVTPTTLLLDNLPADLMQVVLVEVLDREGFSGFYDFVFLPVDGEGLSCGYAVVNLASRACGVMLAARLHGRTDWGQDFEGAKPCNVTWSQPVQGLADNLRMYRNHPSNDESVDEDVRPQLFSRGWPVPFPKPSLPATLQVSVQ